MLFGQKYDIHPQKIHTSCVYFEINFQGLLMYIQCYVPIIKVVYT